MKINRMAVVQGLNLEPVPGQLRYGCGITDFEDFYDIAEYVNEKAYLGNQIVFGDYETGAVYTPFEKERNIAYGGIEWIEGYFYFLKADFSKKTVTIMQYRPDWDCKECFSIGMAEVELYNLRIVGTPAHLISQDEEMRCYYPEQFSIKLSARESVIEIVDNHIYCSCWEEEGVAECEITEDYKYYEKLIVRNRFGDVVSEEPGALTRLPNGQWWLS